MQHDPRRTAGATPSGSNGGARKKRVRIARNLYERNDGRFEAKYTDLASGRFVSKTLGANTRGEARLELGELLGKVARGEASAPSAITFAAVAAEFLTGLEGQVAAGERGSRTLETYKRHIDTRLLPALGGRPIQKITTDHIARLIAEWQGRGLAAWTVRGTLVPFGRILKLALRRGYIASNPMSRLDRSERPRAAERAEQRVLTHSEIASLLSGAPGLYRPLLATAMYSGARQMELLGLTWQDVDFEGGFLHVRFQLSRDAPARRVPLKTRSARRDIVLLPQLGRLLKEHRLESRFSGETDFVFSTQVGTPFYYRNTTTRGLDKATKAAGLGKVKFHDLRHGFASHLILDLGLDVVQVSRQLGHASPSITLDVYSHLFDHARHAGSIREAMAASNFGRLLEVAS